MNRRHLGALGLALLSAGCADHAAPGLTIGAASSLRHVLEDATPAFRAQHGDVPLRFSFEASSTLARQLDAGVQYDAFLSADPVTLERVQAKLDPATRSMFLSNRLALVALTGRGRGVKRPADLASRDGPVAVAMPAVPAGRYARELLVGEGLLAQLEPRFVQARNVRATLALVASGTADFGFVYHSDYLQSAGLELLWVSTPGEVPRITYEAAAAQGAKPETLAFLDWLAGDEFQESALAHGFSRRDP